MTEVVICLGAGGAGKTTVAAALGVEAAQAGRKAVVLTIDPARRLAEVLGLELAGAPNDVHRVPLEAPGELWATMLDARATFEALLNDITEADQARRITENSLFQNLVDSLSGTHEYMAVERLRALCQDEFDLVIVDTPPARHAVDFLDSPGRLVRFLDHPLYRALLIPRHGALRAASLAAQRVATTIGRIVGVGLVEEIIGLFAVFDGLEVGFRDRAAEVGALLESDRTRFVLIAAPDRESLGQSRWLAERLADRGHRPAGFIANRLLPFSDIGGLAELGNDPLDQNLKQLCSLADREQHLIAEFTRQLRGQYGLHAEAERHVVLHSAPSPSLDVLVAIAQQLGPPLWV